MKKSIRIAALLLVLVMTTMAFVGGTFAKYVSTGKATQDSARVAKWAFNVGNTNIAVANPATETEISFNLFDDESQTTDVGNVAESVDDALIIAPGTSGQVELKLVNNSEVVAKYATIATISNTANIPVWYAVVTDGQKPVDAAWFKDTDGTALSSKLSSETGLKVTDGEEGGEDEITYTIFWKWIYDANADAADNALGVAAATDEVTLTLNLSITATQID